MFFGFLDSGRVDLLECAGKNGSGLAFIIQQRIDQKLKQQLVEIKKASGKSIGDILREAVGVQAPSTKNAYARGRSDAARDYLVQYKCSVCGGTLHINTSEEKKAAAQYMREQGWAHGECRD